MPIKSIDPRVTRANIEIETPPDKTLEGEEHWITYEVLTQAKTGDRFVHHGSLHAPNDEMALVLAKEQYGRRNKCTGLWVVKTSNVIVLNEDDTDMFALNTEKIYREAGGYKVMDKINEFKKQQNK